MSDKRLPLQPFFLDTRGATLGSGVASTVVRFRANEIVRHLLDNGGIDLNALVHMSFSQEAWEQFYSLIGYSLCGFHELRNVSDETALEASKAASEQLGRIYKGCRDDGCEMHQGVPRR